MKEVIGNATLYLGDCLEILPTLDKVDVTITDPNYGVTQNDWDKKQDVLDCFDQLDNIVCTCQNPFSAELIQRYIDKFKYSDVWEKSQAVGFLNCSIMPMRKHEDILIFGEVVYNPQLQKKAKENIRPHGNTAQSTNYGSFNNERERSIPLDMTYPSSILRFNNEQGTTHPTQKPVKLFTHLVLTYSNEGDVVVDPFMGSGTTGVSCVEQKRGFVGIEKTKKHFYDACERIENAQRQQSLF